MLDPDSQGINGAQPVRIRIFLWGCSLGGAAGYRSTGVDLVDGHHIGQGETPFIGISLSLSLFLTWPEEKDQFCPPTIDVVLLGLFEKQSCLLQNMKVLTLCASSHPEVLRKVYLIDYGHCCSSDEHNMVLLGSLSFILLPDIIKKQERGISFFFFPFNRTRNSEGRAHLFNVKTDLDLSVVSFWMHLFL